MRPVRYDVFVAEERLSYITERYRFAKPPSTEGRCYRPRYTYPRGMLDVAVTATPLDGHWQLTAPDGRSSHCETLRQAPKIARRLAGPDVEPDVQVSLGGLEDLCADAVELAEQSDAKSVEAIRLRRITARALNAAGIAAADIGYLMGLRRE